MTVKLFPSKAVIILRRPRLLAQIAIGIISRGILPLQENRSPTAKGVANYIPSLEVRLNESVTNVRGQRSY